MLESLRGVSEAAPRPLRFYDWQYFFLSYAVSDSNFPG